MFDTFTLLSSEGNPVKIVYEGPEFNDSFPESLDTWKIASLLSFLKDKFFIFSLSDNERIFLGDLESQIEEFTNKGVEQDFNSFLQFCVDNLQEVDFSFWESTEEFEIFGKKYLVLYDSEADDAFNEKLEQEFDELVLSQIPQKLHPYMDEDRWKSDVKQEGRGKVLSSYDGIETEVTIYDGDFKDSCGSPLVYIYRN